MDLPRTGVEYGTFTVDADAEITGAAQVLFLRRYRDSPGADSTWLTAEWLDDAAIPTSDGGWRRRFRLLLAGPDAGTSPGNPHVLALGEHHAWVRLPDLPEVVVRRAGTVTVALTW